MAQLRELRVTMRSIRARYVLCAGILGCSAASSGPVAPAMDGTSPRTLLQSPEELFPANIDCVLRVDPALFAMAGVEPRAAAARFPAAHEAMADAFQNADHAWIGTSLWGGDLRQQGITLFEGASLERDWAPLSWARVPSRGPLQMWQADEPSLSALPGTSADQHGGAPVSPGWFVASPLAIGWGDLSQLDAMRGRVRGAFPTEVRVPPGNSILAGACRRASAVARFMPQPWGDLLLGASSIDGIAAQGKVFQLRLRMQFESAESADASERWLSGLRESVVKMPHLKASARVTSVERTGQSVIAEGELSPSLVRALVRNWAESEAR